MESYQRLLVCVSRQEQLADLLTYARRIARAAASKSIDLLHVADASSTAGDPPDPPPADTDSITVESLQGPALEYFPAQGEVAVQCDVVTGSPAFEILNRARERRVDLIILGRRDTRGDLDDHARIAERVARKASCSVLVLPPGPPRSAKVERVLVPVRDSECSANALDMACDIAATIDASVIALNVFQVHAGYLRVGTTLAEHQARLEAAAQRENQRLIERVDTRGCQVGSRCTPDPQGRPVPEILDSVEQTSADLIVIGARGRSGAAGVLLGNVTERLIRQSPVPVLAVKKKGEHLGVLQALLTLAWEN
ncbi:MAG: universal stress protein [Phycisphaerae bacterium]